MTWRKVAVGVLQADTYGLGDTARETMISEGVTKAIEFRDAQMSASRFDAKWHNADSRPSVVFAAPEYMLSKKGKPKIDDRLRTATEKATIESNMRKLSARLGTGVLLSPGSISYLEALVLDPAKKAAIKAGLRQGAQATKLGLEGFAAQRDQNAAALDVQVPSGARTAGVIAGQATAARSAASHLRDHPQQYSLAGNTTPSTSNKLAALKRGDVKYIARNEMVLYHRGRDVARYCKIADFNEVPPSRQLANGNYTLYVPGVKVGRATVGGITWGVEVCFDHNLGVLSASPTETLPTVHLLCSASVSRNENHSVVKNKGYVIHSSSDAAQCGVWQRDEASGGDKKLTLMDTQTIPGGGTLYLYVIELDLP